jgi:succinate dehydrogenase / fumarate reductase, cytochrome b subunit
MPQIARPVSPHLGIYKWQLTMMLSIIHRATGIALAVGTIMLCAMLIALASGAHDYATMRAFCGSGIGLFLLLGWTWSLCFHLCNGIRHLLWDAGWGFEIPRAYASGWTVVVLSLVLTVLIWVAAFAHGGAA